MNLTHHRPERIVVGVDGSEWSGRAVEMAVAIAELTAARVTSVIGWKVEVVASVDAGGAKRTEPQSVGAYEIDR